MVEAGISKAYMHRRGAAEEGGRGKEAGESKALGKSVVRQE